jgi:hypothetical protein
MRADVRGYPFWPRALKLYSRPGTEVQDQSLHRSHRACNPRPVDAFAPKIGRRRKNSPGCQMGPNHEHWRPEKVVRLLEESALRNENTAGGRRRSWSQTGSAPSYRHRNGDEEKSRRRPHTPNQKSKPPNALKHGVFAINPAIPNEDPREFQELCSALDDEWQPSGPTEEDAVRTIADAMWRKLRAQKFVRAKVTASTFDPRHPTFDEARGLILFSCHMLSEGEMAFEKQASSYLRADKINYLKQKYPRPNYKSTEEWAEAIITEIRTELLPALGPRFEPGEKLDDSSEAFRKAALEMQLFLCIIHAREFLDDELNVLERLDGRIVRAVKHLVQTKAMKQMLRQTSPDREQPRTITARSTSSDES